MIRASGEPASRAAARLCGTRFGGVVPGVRSYVRHVPTGKIRRAVAIGIGTDGKPVVQLSQVIRTELGNVYHVPLAELESASVPAK